MFLLKKRYWLIITLLLTLFFILRLFPAQWLIYTIQQATPSFQASNISGTVWQGEASYAQWSERGHVLPLGELAWQINISSLLTLTPCVRFSSSAGPQQLKGEACYSIFSKEVSAKEIDVSLPIANIAPFFGVDLSGNITAFIKNIEVTQTSFNNVDANLLWEQASISNGNEWLAAGNIQARLGDENGSLISRWRHIAEGKPAPLEVDITATLTDVLTQKPVIKVEGVIKPRSRKSGFEPILQLIGNKNNDGSYRIDFAE